MKKSLSTTAVLAFFLSITSISGAKAMKKGADNFYKSDAVKAEKVFFNDIYGTKIAGNLFIPPGADASKKAPSIIVGHPMGAVKEQSANLYAQKMAERGFVTLAIDLPFWGESGGTPRNSVSPDIYSEAFSAAADYLGTRPFADKNGIGVIGICGSGGFAISAAKIDPRLKAVATVSMYDMGAANRSGLKGSLTAENRRKLLEEAAEQRYAEFQGGEKKYTGGTVYKIDESSTDVEKEFYEFYRTPRGEYIPEGSSPELATRPSLTSNVKFMTFYPFNDIETISPRPLMFIAGSEAHSAEFSLDAYEKAADPKELVIVEGAGHVDLYDRTDIIPFDKLAEFFKKGLK